MVTATVGVSTISTTAWVAHKTLRLHHERAVRGERRELYGRFIKATQEMQDIRIRISSCKRDDATEKELSKSYRQSCVTAAATLVEIEIMGTSEVEIAAARYYDIVLQEKSVGSADVTRARTELIEAMRKAMR